MLTSFLVLFYFIYYIYFRYYRINTNERRCNKKAYKIFQKLCAVIYVKPCFKGLNKHIPGVTQKIEAWYKTIRCGKGKWKRKDSQGRERLSNI